MSKAISPEECWNSLLYSKRPAHCSALEGFLMSNNISCNVEILDNFLERQIIDISNLDRNPQIFYIYELNISVCLSSALFFFKELTSFRKSHLILW